MNKTELVQALSTYCESNTKEASKYIEGFCKIVSRELAAGSEVALLGFGTFKVAERAERQGRHPRSGEAITIAAARAPKFTAGKTLKDTVAAGTKTGKEKK